MIEESKNFISKYIKSFSASRYRTSIVDEDILNNIFPKISISQDEIENFSFDGKVIFEIGTGWGDFICNYAKKNSDVICIGSDPYKGGLIQTCCKSRDLSLENIRLFHGDGRILIDKIPDKSIDMLVILFPDPWPKRKHNIRRIVNFEYINYVKSRIKNGGLIFAGTDDLAYKEQMKSVFNALDGVKIDILNYEDLVLKYNFYTQTKYHKKALIQNREPLFFVAKVNH